MQNIPGRENGLYHPDLFKSLLAHEVNRSRRYGDSLTLVDLFVEVDPAQAETRNEAELFVMHRLCFDLREADIACKQDQEFLILMPSTGATGARTACERLKKKLAAEAGATALHLSLFMGMTSMPIHNSITSEEFVQNAARALQYARTKRLTDVVAFSEVIKD